LTYNTYMVQNQCMPIIGEQNIISTLQSPSVADG
jgi:hypothetical protein